MFVALLFPPWLYVYQPYDTSTIERPAGYHLIFGEHKPSDRIALMRLFRAGWPVELELFTMRIDQSRLTIQIVGVLLLTVILYLALRSLRR
ncbi:MAG TPA: hypothetical protein VJT71_11400 [Pyrinomonadaceae bacterium]|nr:hypothetical protein [Pyrinomonadaceae bacterium]